MKDKSQYLLANETVLYEAKMHKIIFFMPAFFLFLTLVLVMQDSVIVMLGFVTGVAAIVFGIQSLVQYFTSAFVLTNKRVLVKTGFLQRNTLETLLQKVEGIHVKQSIFGRLMHYGTLIICGTGGSRDPFPLIDNPQVFRQKLYEQLAQ